MSFVMVMETVDPLAVAVLLVDSRWFPHWIAGRSVVGAHADP
jgi:hypothetical protein